MANITHKLSNSLEGALAGGGDPATSPLYVFGPFLKLIIAAGVASITFGSSIWLVVFTIAMVSAMYRLVMTWVTDGSGGSGLSEEEFGGWAVKVNAAITFIEYTLTFLVSMAAMVTFIADRVPLLNESILGMQYRTVVAILLSIFTGWLVNRGPKTAARAFGPATAGVLLLLWVMVFATIWQFGFQLPTINLEAFSGEYLHFTFGGFTRMLAVMTGIEVFANLVAAYDGKPQERSKKAFGSLMIIMGTTVVTMLIVGPAIFAISEPNNENVSVFTQTMDALLPSPFAYMGTLIGIAVLLSASAAAAQGLQNLALGLKDRHYIPAFLGEINRFDVADKPVWLQVGLVSIIFLFVGTNEETYLALYAAGVFILLSMTGWAAAKRLLRELRQNFVLSQSAILVGTALAAAITTAATIVIFEERFVEGAWMYFIFIPMLYVGFSYSRTRLGDPSPAAERLGELEGAMWGGFGFGQSFETQPKAALQPALASRTPSAGALAIQPNVPLWQEQTFAPEFMLVPLDGSEFAEQALPAAEVLARAFHAHLSLVSVFDSRGRLATIPFSKSQYKESRSERDAGETYLMRVTERLRQKGIYVDYTILQGPVAETIIKYAEKHDADMIIISSHGRGGVPRWIMGSVANRMIQMTTKPILIIRPIEGEAPPPLPHFDCLLVALDGSRNAESVLPFVRASTRFDSRVILLSVPEIPDEYRYGAVVEEIAQLRKQAVEAAEEYLKGVAYVLREDGIKVDLRVEGSRPAKTIIRIAEEENVDVVMLTTHGQGEFDRLFMGSVADRVIQNTRSPVFIVPSSSPSPEKSRKLMAAQAEKVFPPQEELQDIYRSQHEEEE